MLADIVIECIPFSVTPCIFTLILRNGIVELSIRSKYLIDMIFVYALYHSSLVCLYNTKLNSSNALSQIFYDLYNLSLSLEPNLFAFCIHKFCLLFAAALQEILKESHIA